MRRRVQCLPVVAVIALAAPAAASAGVLDVYERLADRALEPAPLVPTVAPASLRPLDSTVAGGQSRRRSGYGIRLVHYGPDGPDAVIALEGGSFTSVRSALREGRRLGFRVRRTRVRGRSGYLLTRNLGVRQSQLLWTEERRVYTLGTGTPKKVSVRGLRETAAGLDRLGGAFVGTGGDPDLGTGAVLVTTDRTVTAHVEWGGHCTGTEGFATADRAGSADLTLLRREGTSFASDVRGDPWTGRVVGIIGAASVDLTLRATATLEGETCDTGPISFTATLLKPLP